MRDVLIPQQPNGLAYIHCHVKGCPYVASAIQDDMGRAFLKLDEAWRDHVVIVHPETLIQQQEQAA